MNRRYWPRVVGITGYARVGKDTAAQALVALGYEQRSLADKVRQFAMALNPDIDGTPLSVWLETFSWEQLKERTPAARDWLKRIGNGGRAVFGEKHWLQQLYSGTPADYLVVPDVRFVNEGRYLRRTVADDPAAVIFRVEREGYGPESDFEREVDSVPVDYVVRNEGSIDDFQYAVKEAFLDYMTAASSGRLFREATATATGFRDDWFWKAEPLA